MQYDWDDSKNHINIAKHGIAFDAMERFDWNFAICVDSQFVNGEERELWLGPIDTDLFATVALEGDGETIRIISLRRATNHEKSVWRSEFYG
jgi:uncharacterized DUF497 family protein